MTYSEAYPTGIPAKEPEKAEDRFLLPPGHMVSADHVLEQRVRRSAILKGQVARGPQAPLEPPFLP